MRTTARDEWQRALPPKLAAARARMLEIVAALDVAGRELAGRVAENAWVGAWPQVREFGATAGPVLRDIARFSANGIPMHWSVIIDALRAAAAPPEPPKPKTAPTTPSQLAGTQVVGPRGRASASVGAA
jgi:hypothetical protein